MKSKQRLCDLDASKRAIPRRRSSSERTRLRHLHDPRRRQRPLRRLQRDESGTSHSRERIASSAHRGYDLPSRPPQHVGRLDCLSIGRRDQLMVCV